MSSLKEVGDNTFNAEVIQSTQLTLVDFWAPWCGPCRMLTPLMEKLAAEYQGKMKLVKLNTDDNPETAGKYSISAIPTIIFFKNGQVVSQIVGAKSLSELQKLVDAEKSDLFDVLEYISFNIQPMTREGRATQAKPRILDGLSLKHREFLEFVLFKYIDTGFEELDQSRLPNLIDLKYHSITDAAEALGGVDEIRSLFFDFQKHLYERSDVILLNLNS